MEFLFKGLLLLLQPQLLTIRTDLNPPVLVNLQLVGWVECFLRNPTYSFFLHLHPYLLPICGELNPSILVRPQQVISLHCLDRLGRWQSSLIRRSHAEYHYHHWVQLGCQGELEVLALV